MVKDGDGKGFDRTTSRKVRITMQINQRRCEMGLISQYAGDATNDLGAPMNQYQAAHLAFQNDYPSLKGTPELVNRARNLYRMAKQSGPIALGDLLTRFSALYGDSPELQMLANQV
jgi:hypothetical protein